VYADPVPPRKLYRTDLAALIGIRTDSLQRANPPEPDGRDIEDGHARPWWWESTARAWIASRPGKGWRGKR
jgi:hypothetical protein